MKSDLAQKDLNKYQNFLTDTLKVDLGKLNAKQDNLAK